MTRRRGPGWSWLRRFGAALAVVLAAGVFVVLGTPLDWLGHAVHATGR